MHVPLTVHWQRRLTGCSSVTAAVAVCNAMATLHHILVHCTHSHATLSAALQQYSDDAHSMQDTTALQWAVAGLLLCCKLASAWIVGSIGRGSLRWRSSHTARGQTSSCLSSTLPPHRGNFHALSSHKRLQLQRSIANNMLRLFASLLLVLALLACVLPAPVNAQCFAVGSCPCPVSFPVLTHFACSFSFRSPPVHVLFCWSALSCYDALLIMCRYCCCCCAPTLCYAC